ncbi:5-bromo-4-chloroindolyl phosphate hydrolysis family protein [Bacillus sp. JJ1609]|uniref:5-bromo-4-chloroindolyl phosphate hydrolysis family protein n=1 Tax=Bacillus sp. JJ1609 TaxID=3122977 RepID=UPI0030006B43
MMNPILSFFVRTLAAIPATMFVWLLTYTGFDQTFGVSSLIAIAAGGLVYFGLGSFMKTRFLKKHGLTRREYKYIKKNLDEAKMKINRLQKVQFSIRHIRSLKQRMELIRMIRNIYNLTKKEPKRFYQAEQFYFSHLDSVLELTEKYAFLTSQSKVNRDMQYTLEDTQRTLIDMTGVVEKDLYHVLSDDYDHLNFEIDVAKHRLNSAKETKYLDGKWRTKK